MRCNKLVKRLDIPILFALHNFNYHDAGAFQLADYVIVPTEFCRQHYWDTLGLASLKLPLVVDPARVCVPDAQPTVGVTLVALSPSRATEVTPTGKYVTFVNPEPRKGIHVFARIAEMLDRRRPDIRLLIVEGASKASFLPKLGIDLSGVKNVRIMPNTPDSRQFLVATKILLMPSLMENAGLVAMEAMLNGIPVLASNRGALPETIGDAGFLFDIPAKYTPETRDVQVPRPTAEEVEPWVETIIRLWDDAAEYERWSRAARERAQQWHPDRLAPIYREFFSQHKPSARAAAGAAGGCQVAAPNRSMLMLFERLFSRTQSYARKAHEPSSCGGTKAAIERGGKHSRTHGAEGRWNSAQHSAEDWEEAAINRAPVETHDFRPPSGFLRASVGHS